MIRFGSVCSGIEAASVAWHPLGWKAAWLSEIEPFPSAALAHHYPDAPNLGDMTKLPARIASGEIEAPDVFCGGTPCQAFSVAGKRESLADARGNLSLTFCTIADTIDAARHIRGLPASIVFWENVPGILSTKDNAFGCFLAQLCGGDEPLNAPDGWPNAGCVSGPSRTAAWRVLDAQYFGLAQRRKRVFVVSSARDGFDPAGVLFEFEGVRRDFAPSRGAREEIAGTITASSGGSDENDAADGRLVASGVQPVADSGSNRTPVVLTHAQHVTCIAFPERLSGTQCASAADLSPSLGALNPMAIAFGVRDVSPTITSNYGKNADSSDTALGPNVVMQPVAYTTKLHNAKSNNAGKIFEERTVSLDANSPPQVRRLTVRECERLQGFQFRVTPDYPGAWQDAPGEWWSPDYTLIPFGARKKISKSKLVYLRQTNPELRTEDAKKLAADGPRYKALGNSWAIPCVAWIGDRINQQLTRGSNG